MHFPPSGAAKRGGLNDDLYVKFSRKYKAPERVRGKKNQRNNWKSLQMQKRTIRGSEWRWKGTARKEFEIRCPLCPLNRPVAVVSLAHNALSADKQSLKTQTHHSQSVPVKGNLAYWCPFHSSQLKPADISFFDNADCKYAEEHPSLCDAKNGFQKTLVSALSPREMSNNMPSVDKGTIHKQG